MFAAILAIDLSTPTVTLAIPAARAPVVLEAVGRQLGMRLSADPTLAREVFCLRVVNVPAADLLAHLAEAAGGEWRRSGDEHILAPAKWAAKHDFDLSRAKHAKAIAAMITQWKDDKPPKRLNVDEVAKFAKQFREDMVKASTLDQLPETMATPPFDDDPKDVLLHELIKALPLAAYVDLPPEQRLVFSDAPNQMQTPFPSSTEGPLSRFRANQSLIDQYVAPTVADFAKKYDMPGEMLLSSKPLPDDYKIDFAVRSSPDPPDCKIVYTLLIVDTAGHVLKEADESAVADEGADASLLGTPPGQNWTRKSFLRPKTGSF